MANGGRINYTIGFQVDKTGLNDFQKTLSEMKNLGAKDIMQMNPNITSMNQAMSVMQKLRGSISEIELAFKNAFDPTIGITNITKLNQNLKQLDLNKVATNFKQLGPEGEKAFSQIAAKAMTTNLQFKETNNILNKMGTTLMNTLKWTFSSSLINRFVGSIQQAVGYVEHLDSSLNDIRIVTKKSADEMAKFGKEANAAAQALGKATTDYTEASLIYYQQGLSDEEVKARAETTLKVANVTGQATKAVSEELTAVWNGYKVNAEEAEVYVDKLAAVAATTASNLEELSTGMSKVASAAANMGVDIDQLNAMLSTVISVTRQAPETAGTAYKTIFARISDLKLGDTDEDGLKLGDVSSGLQKLGIEILDSKGELRDLGLVIEEVGNKWKTWTSAQQAAIAQLMAGKRQYNNLVALFSNWDMYENAINTSKNATGELQKQQDIYMESTEAHLQQLKTEWEDVYDSIIDPESINTIADALTGLASIVKNLIDAMGGGKGLLLGISAVITRVFGKQIASNLQDIITKFQNAKTNAAQLKAEIEATERFAQNMGVNPEAVNRIVELKKYTQEYYDVMSQEEIAQQNELVKEAADIAILQQEWEAAAESKQKYITGMATSQGGKGNIEKISKFNLKTEDPSNSKYSQGMEAAAKVVEKANKSAEKTISVYDKLKEAIQRYNEELKQSQSDQDKINKVQSKWQKTLTKLKTEYQKTSTEYVKNGNLSAEQEQKLQQAFSQTEQSLDKLTNAYSDYANNKTKIGGSSNAVTQSLKQEEAVINEITEATKRETQEFIDQAPKITESINKQKSAFENIKTVITSFGKQLDMRKAIKVGTDLISSVSSLGFAFSSLNSIEKTWADDTISFGEKITQSLMSVGMVVSSLGSSFASLKSAISGTALGGAIKGFASKIGMSATALGGWAAAAALAVVGGIKLANMLDDAAEAFAVRFSTAAANAAKETTEATEAIKNNRDELANSFNDLDKQYKTSEISLKELQTQVHDLALQHGEEELAVNSLSMSYQELKQSILDLQSASDEEFLRSAEAEKTALSDKLTNVIWRGLSGSEQDYETNQQGEKRKTIDLEGTYGGSLNPDSDLIKKLQSLGIDYYGYGHIDLEQFANAAVRNQKELEDILNHSGEEAAEQLQKILDQNKEDLERAKLLTSEEDKSKQDIRVKAVKEADIYNQEQANQQYQEYIKQALAAGKTIKEGNQEFAALASDLDNDYLRLAADEAAAKQSLKEAYVNNTDIDTSTWTKLDANINNLFDKLHEKGYNITDTTLLTSEQWKEYLTGGITDTEVEEIAQKIQGKLDESAELARQHIIENSGAYSDGVGSAITSAISGSLDTTTEEFQVLLENLNAVKEAFPELTNEVETFSETGLVGSERWIQMAYQLQSALDRLEFDNLNKKIADSKEKLDNFLENKDKKYDENGFEIQLEVDDTEFQETMQEIMDSEYQIDVEVHSDAERDFNQLVSSLEKADEMASKIGEDFIVAADDIRDLNNAFPGILEGIEYLGDGTIKLNEEIVQSAIAAASEQEAASTQELTTKLQNAATELRAKAEVYDSMADIAHQAAEGQIDADTYQTEIAQKLDELEVENNKIAAQTEMDNATAVADNSNENAGISAENWTKSYQQAAQASYEFANTAIQNAASAAAGGGPLRQGNFNFTWGGKGGSTSSEAKSATGFQSASDFKSSAANDEATYRSMAEEARQAANDIEGMMAGAAAKATEVLKNNQAAAGGRKSSSGSGGGGGKDADQMDHLEREEDIYRVINEELENIESTLGRVQEIQSHKWGTDYQKVLEKENKLLDKQVEKLEEKQKLQVGDLSARRKQLEDVGVKFSEDGSVMLNAEQVLNSMYDNYNSMIDKYNAMSASEQEVYKAQLETEKNRMDAIENKIDEYESTYSDLQSTIDELLSKHYEIIENNINQFNNKVNVQLELNDARKEWDEFWADVIEDVDETDFGGQIAKSLSQLKTLVGLNGDVSKSSVKVLTDHVMNNVDQVYALIASADRGGEDSLFGDATKEAKENLMDYRNQLMSALKESKENLDSIADSYLKELQSAQDLMDEQVEGWESIEKHLEHNLEMIKLIDGEKAFAAIGKQYEEMYKNNLNLLTTEKQSKDYWAERVQHYQSMLAATEEGTKEWKTYSEALEESVKQYRTAVEDLDAAVEKSIKLLQDERENLNNATFDALDRALSDNIGLEALEDEWKLIDEYSSKYYDNVERYLNMEEYTNYLDDAANAIGLSAENQQKLNEFRDEELKKLNEKTKLTEYDIAESKARLEIMKAEMALQDAQRNKSNMRLRRDSQGNYTYQYGSNENDVDNAEAGVLTAKKAWYELVKKQYRDASQYAIDCSKDVYEYSKKYNEAILAGDREAAEKYLELLNKAKEQTNFAFGEAEKNKQDLFSGTAKFFAQVENAEILEHSKTTVRKLVDEWTGEGEASFTGAVKKAVTELGVAQSQYMIKVDETLKTAGDDYYIYRTTGIDPTTESLKALVQTNKEFAKQLGDLNTDLTEHETLLKSAETAYNSLKDSAVTAIKAANDALEKLSKTWVDAKKDVEAYVQSAKQASSISYDNVAPSTSGGGSSGGGGGYSGGSPTSSPNATSSGNTSYIMRAYDSRGFLLTGYPKTYTNKEAMKKVALSVSPNYAITLTDSEGKKIVQTKPSDYYISRENKIKSFRSGGYTGAWGDDGKWAVLHQKELVLNQSDTENVLQAVQMLRALPLAAMANSILTASNATMGMVNTISSNVSPLAGSLATSNNSTNNMTVNADFSGVRSADAIYQALLQLENYGMQQSYSVAPHINNPY